VPKEAHKCACLGLLYSYHSGIARIIGYCDTERVIEFLSLFFHQKGRKVSDTDQPEPTRRDFLYIATGAFAAGSAFAVWPLIDQMNPDASVLALSSIEVDLTPIEVGQSMTVKWRGSPIFIRRRTANEIAQAVAVPLEELPDPEPDSARAVKPEWLIMVGICTHLGCIPKGQSIGDERGDYGGWFCPCHGSHYDTAGRIRKGPAPLNLVIPPINYLEDTKIKIG